MRTLRITSRQVNDAVTLAVVGEIDLVTAPQLRDAVNQLLTTVPPPRQIRVDLSAVRFMDSSGITALLAARAGARSAGSRLLVSSAAPAPARVIHLTGLTPLLIEPEPST
jgi:anti-sigma B factor antagonist